jgi:L-threonylcarbamoyladenylate synthase
VSDELSEYLERRDVVLDGGSCEVGVESTIIDCTSNAPKILRPGAITEEMIEHSTGLDVLAADGVAIRVSGSLESHYSPKAKVILDQTPVIGQGFIAMADIIAVDVVVRLAAPKTHEEFARILYAALRAADAQGLKTVVVQQPVGEGIAIAIRDRLKRAAQSNSK